MVIGDVLITVLLCLCLLVKLSCAGSCWSSVSQSGRCTELLAEKMTKEECCRDFDGATTAWSSDVMDSGTLFFWRVLGGGVKCIVCRESCSGVQCSEGKKCVIRNGTPKCICSPNCQRKDKTTKGPVCGTDGRNYRNLCRLKKRACRRNSRSLQVAYNGLCQNSCETIQCPTGKFCLVDQNLVPHCVKCERKCPPKTPGGGRHVCGTDGHTYGSVCHIRAAACKKGKAIPVAYKGRCKKHPTCKNLQCKDKQSCLVDQANEQPRCVTCSSKCPKPNSPAGLRREMGGPICGSNNRTYPSWCHMMKDACATGYVLETKHSGSCHQKGPNTPMNTNTVLNGESADLL